MKLRDILGLRRRMVTVVGPDDLPDTQRRQSETFLAFHRSLKNVQAAEAGGPYTCPCCGHLTLPTRGGYDLCPECDWEDDGQDDHDSQLVREGPNGPLSLDAAREQYLHDGGTRGPHVAPAPPG